MELEHTKLCRKEIKLTAQEVNFLGPELHLEHCNIHSQCDNGTSVIAGVRMVGGRFIQESPLTDFQFKRAHLLNVKFTGTFIGCDFGDWETSERSSVSECDYSEAVLDGCRFLNCKMEDIKLPKWPCFALLNPLVARETVLSRKWPSRVGLVLDVYTDNDPECVAICGNAEAIAEKNQMTLEDFLALVMALPGIIIQD